MSYPVPGESVTHIKTRPGSTTNKYGEDVMTTTETTIDNVVVGAQLDIEEVEVTGDSVRKKLSLYFTGPDAENLDVFSKDKFIVRGVTYEAIGDGFLWRSPFTGEVFGYTVQIQKYAPSSGG